MAQTPSSNRPLSPHLQIWRWTVTMAASITQRATGFINYGGTLLLALWMFSLAANGAGFGIAKAILGSPIGLIIIGGYVWSLCFHMLNGLRYLYWDSGRGLAPKTATATAWMTYAASLILAIAIIGSGLSARGGL